MKASLKDHFRSIDLLKSDVPIRERIGALYLWGHQAENPEAQKRLREILRSTDSKDTNDIQLSLHAAIILAQNGEFDGVEYLVTLLQGTSDRETLELAEIALRNCNQFPLAALIAQTLDLRSLNGRKDDLLDIMKLSDDDLFELSQTGNPQTNFDQLVEKVKFLAVYPRKPSRRLGIGTVLTTPLREDRGFRYTGFAIIDTSQQNPVVIPYDLGDVLNRNDQRARQDVLQLLRPPGRKAIIVYRDSTPHEATQLYVFPFPPLETEHLEALTAKICDLTSDLEVGIVADVNVSKRGDYRVITSSGQTRLMKFKKDIQKIGNVFIGHEQNSQMLSTRLRFSKAHISKFSKLFSRRSSLDRAVYIRSYAQRHYFASTSGEILSKTGKATSNMACFIETVNTREGKQFRSIFEVPELLWTSIEQTQILSQFFNNYSENIGVVLESYEYDGRLYARAVQALTGLVSRLQLETPMTPGTVVYFETGKDGRLYSNPISNYILKSACDHCFGTGFGLCASCNATGEVNCSICNGSQFVVCPECNGGGRTTCGHCDGRGVQDLECRECTGTGTCSGCNGTGIYIAGECNRCGGSGTVNGYTCRKCDGDGKYKLPHKWCNGTGRCNKCDGSGTKTIACRTCGQTGLWGCGTCHEKTTVPCSCNRGYMICPTCQGQRVSVCSCRRQGEYEIISV